MNYRTIVTAAIIIGCCLTPAAALAQQSYTSMLNTLKTFEERLSAMESAQTQLLQRLDTAAASSDQAANAPVTDGDWQSLRAALDSIRADVEQIHTEAEFAAITARATAEQVGELEAARDQSPPVASTGLTAPPGSAMPAFDFPALNRIELSGFGDFGYQATETPDVTNDFALGQVEVDLVAPVADHVEVTAAIAYEPADEIFALGCFTVDFHLFGSEGGHLHPARGIEHSGIIAGQFDIPFGIDWQRYASADRDLVSQPRVVEATHDSWNDLGLQAYLATPTFNAVVFGANGFGYNYDDPIAGPVEINSNMALGGRAGFIPFPGIEFGGSIAGIFDSDDNLDAAMAGADLSFHTDRFAARGEYVALTTGRSRDQSETRKGWYGECRYDFGALYSALRYDWYAPAPDTTPRDKRLSLGGGWRVMEDYVLKTEYQINPARQDDVLHLQLVVAF